MIYQGERVAITPSLTADNWVLEAAANEIGKVLAVYASGEATAGAAVNRVRWARATGHSGALTALTTIARIDTHASVANLIAFGTPFATTQPTLDAGSFLTEALQPYGGVIRWQALHDRRGWPLVGAASPTTLIVSRNASGTSTMNYGVTWEE